MIYITIAAVEGYSYSDAKLGQSDGTVNGTSVAIVLPVDFSDPRLNTFWDNYGYPKVELCNRYGQAGTVGSGKHYILGVPLPGSLPPEKANLSTIANPYATVAYNGLLYIIEFDTSAIQAIDLCTYDIVLFDDQPAFYFQSNYSQGCGMDLELVIESYDSYGNPAAYAFYALFSNGDSFAGPWYPSSLLRLQIDDTPATHGMLTELSRVDVGINATCLIQVRGYTPPGESAPKNFLLASAIGGSQNPGTGNGALSVVSVVESGPGFSFIANAIDGTYSQDDVMLDLKSIAATPKNSSGEGYLFVMAASYDSNFAGIFQVGQVKVSDVINRAYAIKNAPSGTIVPPYNLGDNVFTLLDNGVSIPGYFWTVFFASTGSGSEGKLVIGCGSKTNGDQLLVYDVTNSGVDTSSSVTISATDFYGATGALINTMTFIVTAAGGASGNKAKVMVATPPNIVLEGKVKPGELYAKVLRSVSQGK
jgi:hypothetical protein